MGLGVLAAGSLSLSVVLTDRAQPWAFYSLPTRAWELAGGGVLALAAPRLRRLPDPVATALGWSGLCGIGWAVAADSAHTQYPGTAALLPVAGAMAVIAAGCAHPRWGPDLLLARRPMQETGRLSYSLYLWHWPVLIIGVTLGARTAGARAWCCSACCSPPQRPGWWRTRCAKPAAWSGCRPARLPWGLR